MKAVWYKFNILYNSVEAGMIALNRGGTFLIHEDFVEGIAVVQAKKKSSLNYYAWIVFQNININILYLHFLCFAKLLLF